MITLVIEPVEIVAIGLGWLAWIVVLGPQMWRWHVQLPRERRALVAEPNSRGKERTLRRIDLQLSHFWARRSGMILVVAITLLMLASTLTIVLASLLSPR